MRTLHVQSFISRPLTGNLTIVGFFSAKYWFLQNLYSGVAVRLTSTWKVRMGGEVPSSVPLDVEDQEPRQLSYAELFPLSCYWVVLQIKGTR